MIPPLTVTRSPTRKLPAVAALQDLLLAVVHADGDFIGVGAHALGHFLRADAAHVGILLAAGAEGQQDHGAEHQLVAGRVRWPARFGSKRTSRIERISPQTRQLPVRAGCAIQRRVARVDRQALRPGGRSQQPRRRSRAGAARAWLFGEALDEIGGAEQQAGRAERSQPALVDRLDAAAAVQPGEHPVHRQPEIMVVARQRERVGLDRKILVQQPEAAAVRGWRPWRRSAWCGPRRSRRPCPGRPSARPRGARRW